jgi:hypothetical protein
MIDSAHTQQPYILLQPTADAVLISMKLDSLIEVGVSWPRLSRLWLSSIR